MDGLCNEILNIPTAGRLTGASTSPVFRHGIRIEHEAMNVSQTLLALSPLLLLGALALSLWGLYLLQAPRPALMGGQKPGPYIRGAWFHEQ